MSWKPIREGRRWGLSKAGEASIREALRRCSGRWPGKGSEMTEPLFFDCLTEAQLWSLFDSGVLHGYLLPVEVYARLERIAPNHGCYLFTWPEGADLPSLQDIVPGVAPPAEAPPARPHNHRLETPITEERTRSAIEDFCARVNTAVPPEGERVHVITITTTPQPGLRAGPSLEPRPRDLNSMSLHELEAYLDEVLRVDEANDVGSATTSAKRLSP
jgi:hypothetical protein